VLSHSIEKVYSKTTIITKKMTMHILLAGIKITVVYDIMARRRKTLKATVV